MLLLNLNLNFKNSTFIRYDMDGKETLLIVFVELSDDGSGFCWFTSVKQTSNGDVSVIKQFGVNKETQFVNS